MRYINRASCPLGTVLMASDGDGLTGLWFEGQKYFAFSLSEQPEEVSLPVFEETKRWLDIYFSGKEPDFMPPLHLTGTAFQKEIWELLLEIPYGCTTTYGELAKYVAGKRGLSHMSAQAVGGAVSHNKISILVPCHRVIGSNGSLTGYAGGISRKIEMLKLEGAWKDTLRF